MDLCELLSITQEKEGGERKGQKGLTNIFGLGKELSQYDHGYKIYARVFVFFFLTKAFNPIQAGVF